MFTVVLVALVIGGLIICLVQKNRNQVLKTREGWWGAGSPSEVQEDVTIQPFKVTTSDEELQVRVLLGLSHRTETPQHVLLTPLSILVSSVLNLLCQDLYWRIDQTRPVPSLEASQFHYGFNSHYLQKVVSYWRNDFDWRRQVDKLNQYPHFKTKIEGRTAQLTQF